MSGEKPVISVIIPVYNEADGIDGFLREAEKMAANDGSLEWLIVDGGSTDGTVAVVKKAGFPVLISPRKGRAAQMNHGASQSKGGILYFLHADTIPPLGFPEKIRNAVKDGAESGCFRLAFDEPNPVMRLYAWFTRFDLLPFRFGDQSLFVLRTLFQRLDGFRNDHILMEDNEFIRRLRKHGNFRLMPDEVVTSARKYRENGFVRLQIIFTIIFFLYYAGVSQETLVAIYRDLVRGPKM